MKKILLAVLLFVSLFVVSGCKGSKSLPQISNPDGTYLTATEGEFTYTLTNKNVYEKLKSNVGLNMLLDMVDRDLLKATKDAEGTSYWDLISNEDIEKDLNSDIFPNTTEGLLESEIDEERNEYLEQLFLNYGLTELEDVYEFYHLTLAKDRYAEDKLRAEVAENDFTDEEYQAYFNNNYKKGFYAIIVSFESIKLYEDALRQLDITISNGKWLKTTDSTELSDKEIVEAFIDLYNMNNAYKLEDYPDETLTLNQGEDYTIDGDQIVFDFEKAEELHYTNAFLNAYQKEIITLLDERMSTYPEGDYWYTNQYQSYKQGSRYTFVLKLGEDVTEFDDVKETIKEDLIKQKLNANYITTEIIKLRAENNFVIYDSEIEQEYVETVKSYKQTYNLAKKSDGNLVAEASTTSYTADQLFEAMNKDYGMSVAIGEVEYLRFLINSNLNTIYDYDSTAKKENDKVLDSTRWTVIKQQLQDEKDNFNANMYEEYGYPKSFGWENFLKDVFGVESEQELLYYYLQLEVKDDYTKTLSDLKGKTESSDLWQFYKTHMEATKDKYFNVEGIHLLISVNDDTGQPVDPENWTAKQVEYAKELYREVMNFLKTESNLTKTQKFEGIVDAFNKSPRFLPGTKTTAGQKDLENVHYTYNNIEVSKYKSAGLSVKYEDLGQFSNDQMVPEFDEAVKSIWDADPSSTTETVYGLNPDSEGNWNYLVTKFGYHVYVNEKSFEIPTWDENKVIPTLGDIILYLTDPSDKKLSQSVKTAITTYYDPIYKDLTSANNVSLHSYTAIKELQFSFEHDDYSIENFNKLLELKIEGLRNNLKFK